ncbi:hypothetical protein ABVT39_012718 [Epinephelus coioides]
MDVMSLSRSEDDFVAHNPEDQAPSFHTPPPADPASEAEDFPDDAMPDTPPPWVLQPSKKHGLEGVRRCPGAAADSLSLPTMLHRTKSSASQFCVV